LTNFSYNVHIGIFVDWYTKEL